MNPPRADLAKPYVIMLDDMLEVYTHDWPISNESDTLDDARRLGQSLPGNPRLLPRSQYNMSIMENKSLIDPQNGRIHRGAIYACHRKV